MRAFVRRKFELHERELTGLFGADRLCAASKEKEYEQIIRQTFAPAVLLESFPRAVISIVVQVIEDNGSVLSVAINAVALALMDAGIPMVSVVTSASCAIFSDGSLVLDPSSPEEEVAFCLLLQVMDNHVRSV